TGTAGHAPGGAPAEGSLFEGSEPRPGQCAGTGEADRGGAGGVRLRRVAGGQLSGSGPGSGTVGPAGGGVDGDRGAAGRVGDAVGESGGVALGKAAFRPGRGCFT